MAAPIIPLSASRTAPQIPTSRRVAANGGGSSAIQIARAAAKRLNRFIDMVDMGAERQDRAPDMKAPIDPRPAQHHATFLLQKLKQSFTARIGVSGFGQEAKGNDG
jgi:hypothetical protein